MSLVRTGWYSNLAPHAPAISGDGDDLSMLDSARCMGCFRFPHLLTPGSELVAHVHKDVEIVETGEFAQLLKHRSTYSTVNLYVRNGFTYTCPHGSCCFFFPALGAQHSATCFSD